MFRATNTSKITSETHCNTKFPPPAHLHLVDLLRWPLPPSQGEEEGLAILCTGSRWSSQGTHGGKNTQKKFKSHQKDVSKRFDQQILCVNFRRHVQASYLFFVHKATLRKSEVNHGSSALISSHGHTENLKPGISTNIHHWSKVCFKGAPSTSALPGPALLRLTGAAEAGSNASPWATSFNWYQWHQHTTEKRESTVDSTVNPQQSLRDFIVYRCL